MKITILGSGTLVPSLTRNPSATIIELKNKLLLFDCGSGTLQQLLKTKYDYKDIDTVIISHFHPDHITDLVPLFHALNWTPEYTREKPLTIIGPKGMQAWLDHYAWTVAGTKPKTYEVIVKEITDSLVVDEITLQAYKTDHCTESQAYKFIYANKSVVFTSDTLYDEELANFAKHADLLFIDASFEEGQIGKGHMTVKEAGKIGKLARAKKLILTHLYPPINKVKRIAEASEQHKNVILAEDFMSFDV